MYVHFLTLDFKGGNYMRKYGSCVSSTTSQYIHIIGFVSNMNRNQLSYFLQTSFWALQQEYFLLQIKKKKKFIAIVIFQLEQDLK